MHARAPRRVPDPPGAAVAALRRRRATATSTTAATSTPTTAPATSSSSPASASTPTSGVTDAYATVRRGDRQWTIRCSDALGDDRLAPSRRALPGRGRRAAAADPPGVRRRRPRPGLRPAPGRARSRRSWSSPTSCAPGRGPSSTPPASPRWARWEGSSAGRRRRDRRSTPDVWVGTRDRSWGIRPVGEGEPAGRPADEPTAGLWWLYVPLRFDDFAVVVIVQEDAGRLPHAQRRHPGVARRPRRAARLARGRDRLPVRHPHPRAGHDPA